MLLLHAVAAAPHRAFCSRDFENHESPSGEYSKTEFFTSLGDIPYPPKTKIFPPLATAGASAMPKGKGHFMHQASFDLINFLALCLFTYCVDSLASSIQVIYGKSES